LDFTANLEELDEDYIVSSQVFELTGIKDSLEPLNRRMYAFNTQLDRKVLYPASRVYSAVVPKPIRKGISNFYNNFNEIPTFVNSVLQLKPGKAVNALGRFFVNSTVGVLGVADVATKFGMKKDPETMGDTLGHYGVRGGSYLILPVFGPSNLRDAFGTAVDTLGEGAVRGLVEDKLFFDTGVFDKNIYGSKSTFLKVVKWLIVLFMSAIYGVLNFIIIGIIMAMYTVYSKVIGRYTADGMRKKEYLDGMKMYIKTAEANQIMKFNDVDELVAYFKGILPYAVALGVKNEVVKLMKNTIKLYDFDESTYSYINRGVHFNTYDSFILANTVSRVYNNAYNKIREERFSTLRNDSGSSSGFGGGGFSSGGGFSGGGSGGGGGGSW